VCWGGDGGRRVEAREVLAVRVVSDRHQSSVGDKMNRRPHGPDLLDLFYIQLLSCTGDLELVFSLNF
ncbi:hypothetical protein WICPIJ_001280, partial [Wickerhamomyces pijperi]